jgi:LL-diaminopimelate aminotransferase
MTIEIETNAARIQQLPPYLFAKIDETKKSAIAAGIDLIDLGVGDPDLTPPRPVIDSLIRAVQDKDSHHYASYTGIPELRDAFAKWFKKRFGVTVDPECEVLPLLGSKEGIGHIFLSHVDPGDEVLIPDPGYPVYTAGTILAGAVPRYFRLRHENGYLPDIDELEELVSYNTRMMWINYPSNPTTTMADMETFQKIVQFAEEHGILVCHDMAYSEITYDGKEAISFLQTAGGKEVGVEFHSLSKTFCMPGWRVGFAVGNAEVIKALAKVKTNLDSGIFIPVQKAAITALLTCEEDAKKLCNVFKVRRNRFVEGLRDIGWNIPLPPSTFYVWAKIPSDYDSMEFCTLLLEKAGIICTPGVGFGNFGEGFVRMSLTVSDERLDLALDRLKNMNITWS